MNLSLRLRWIAILLAATVAVTGCGDDEPIGVVADAGGTADTGGGVDGDVGGDAGADVDATGPTAKLTFAVRHAKGTGLVDPESAAIYGLDLDKYPGAENPGFQLDVEITGTNVPDGTEIDVRVNGVSKGKVQMTAGAAKLEKVTIDCGAAQSSIAVEATVAGSVVTAGKAVALICDKACTAAIEPVAACLSGDADAAVDGFQTAFVVTTSTPDCTHASLEVTDTDGKVTTTAEVALVGGKATVAATLSAKATGLVDAKASVVAVVSDKGQPDRPVGKSVAQGVTITTEKPAVSLLQPAKDTLNLSDDGDGNPANGVQVTLVGAVTTLSPSDIGAIQVLVDDVEVAKVTQGLNGSFNVDVSFATSKQYVVKIVAKNSCGLSGETSKTITVQANQAKLVITSPATAAVLNATHDTNKATEDVLDAIFAVSQQDAPDGTKISIFCRKNEAGSTFSAAPLGEATVVNGAASLDIPVTIDTKVYGNAVVCVARDNGPNKAESAPVAVTVGLPPPCMTAQLPAEGSVTNAATLAVAVTATGLEGAVVDAKLSLTNGATFIDGPIGKVKNGAFSGSIALQVGTPPVALPDGSYTLTFEAVDAWGNKISAGSCSDVTRTFAIDRAAPTLKLAIPTKSVLDPAVDPDSDDNTPGYQTKVVFGLSGEPAGSTSTVCASVGGFALPCKQVVGNGNVSFDSVSLQPGFNVITAYAIDQLGNKSGEVKVTVTLQSNAAIVAWIKPAGSVTVVPDTIAVEVSVTDQKLGVPVNGATLTLILDNKEIPAVSFASTGNGTYGATVTGLKPGANVLQVAALPPGATDEGVTPQLTITRKTTAPTLAFASFKDGDVVNLASSFCVPGLTDCVTNVGLVTTEVANGSAASLTVACGLAAPVTATATVQGGALSFPTVTLSHGTTCQLTAQVTDEAGQQATAGPIAIQVDRVAPKLGGISPNTGAYLALSDINKDPSDGVQTSISLFVQGLAKSQKIKLQVQDDSGKVTFTAEVTPSNDLPDSGSAKLVSFGVVSLPAGKTIKLTFTAADVAGNTASFTRTVFVSADGAEIRMTAPAHAEGKACTSKADCGGDVCYQSKCAVPWNKLSNRLISVVALGIQPGAKARLCSDNSGVSGAACAGAGKTIAEVTFGDAPNAVMDLKGLADGLHGITAELLPLGADAAVAANWVLSTATGVVSNQRRRILVDSVPPALASVLPPTATGVPASCLARASQQASDGGAPGGTFIFAATMAAEDATISLLSGASVVGSATSTNKVAAVTIKLGAEGQTTLVAVAKDLVGNESTALNVGSWEVNTIIPIGQFLSPNKGQLIAGDLLDVRVGSPSDDVEAQPTTLKDVDKTVGSAAMTKGEAAFPHSLFSTLSDGKHTLTAVIADRCGNTATVATQPAQISVDTTKPVIAFTAPTAGQVFGDGDDASATQGGYQRSATFTTSGAATWKLELGTNCDATFANCGGFAPIGGGNVTNDGGAEPAVVFDVPFGATTQYALRLTATDAAGNAATTQVGFEVKVSGCMVVVTGLPASGIVNTASCATAGQSCASVKLALAVEYLGPCGTVETVDLVVDGKVAQSKAPVSSKATLDLTVLDGTKPKVEVNTMAGGKATGSGGAKTLTVDLTLPKVAFVAAQVLGVTTPAGGSTALLGKSVDRDLAKNGHQLHLALQADDAGLAGGKVTKLVDGSNGDLSAGLALPLVFASSGKQTAELKFVTVKEDALTTATATVEDAAGNVGTAAISLDIDWTPPTTLALDPIEADDVNRRRPYVRLGFKAPNEDGTTGAKATSYEVVYARKDIASAADFDAACKASALPATKLPAPGEPGASETIVVEGPDGRAPTEACKFATLTDNGVSKYYFAVRAVDAAGNKGAISNVASTDLVRLRYAKLTSTAAPWNNTIGFAYPTNAGDVNGDGVGDVFFGASGTAKACLVYGQAANDQSVSDLDIKAQSAATHTCFDNAVSLGQLAEAGDVNGDGVDDLVVSFGQGTNVKREVHVYLGKKGVPLSTTPAVKITNITASVSSGLRALAVVGNFNGDKTAGGKPIHDIAFTMTKTTTVAMEQVFVVPGNATWSQAAPVTIDIENTTDRTTHNVLRIVRSDYTGSPSFGILLAGQGDVLIEGDGTGPQYDDLMLGQYASNQGIYVVRGRAWTGSVTVSLSEALDSGSADDQTALKLRPSSTGGSNFRAPVLIDYDGDSLLDVVAVHAETNKPTYLYWSSGAAINKAGKGQLVLNPTLLPGQTDFYSTGSGYVKQTAVADAFAAGDFFDVGKARTAIATVRPSWAGGGRVELAVRGVFVRPGGAAGAVPSLEFEDLAIPNVFKPGSATLGSTRVAGGMDFNGDGYPDLAIACYPDGYAILAY